jgi:uncharacterized protein (TIGR02391 family)
VLTQIRQLLNSFSDQRGRQLRNTASAAEKLQEACHKIERSWSGSFAGWHGRMYFRDFATPSLHQRFSGEWGGIQGIPHGWEEKQPEQVKAKLESIVGSGFSIEEFERDVKELRSEVENLRDDITLKFAEVGSDDLPPRFKVLISEIEHFEFGKTKNDFVIHQLPKGLASRDLEAVRQGIYLPAWLYYEGVGSEAQSLCENTDRFLGRCERILKHLDGRPLSDERSAQPAREVRDLHPEIYKKCQDLFEKAAYAEAVEKGFKVVRDRLRKLTGYETGSDAFGKGGLHISGAAAPNVDEDFNAAVKFLTMAIDRFRNEKSHTSDSKIDDPVRAYEYLRLSSLAMNFLELAEVRQ